MCRPAKLPSLVYFIGIDGSGKTAHARRLVQELRSMGIHCKRVNLTGNVFEPLSVVPRSLAEFAIHRFGSNNHVAKATLFLYELARYLELSLEAWIRVLLPTKLGIVVVCDRYLLDPLVEMWVAGLSGLEKRIGRRYLNAVRLARLIMLDINETTSLSRKNDIPSLEFLRIRRNAYQHLARLLGVPVVSTDTSFEEAHARILCILGINLRQEMWPLQTPESRCRRSK